MLLEAFKPIKEWTKVALYKRAIYISKFMQVEIYKSLNVLVEQPFILYWKDKNVVTTSKKLFKR